MTKMSREELLVEEFKQSYMEPPYSDTVQPTDEVFGYHMTNIENGVYGEASKIKEEFEEFWDASQTQGCRVMELVELSDLIGAIEAYVEGKYNLGIDDLIKFSNVTKRAFQNGKRTPKE